MFRRQLPGLGVSLFASGNSLRFAIFSERQSFDSLYPFITVANYEPI